MIKTKWGLLFLWLGFFDCFFCDFYLRFSWKNEEIPFFSIMFSRNGKLMEFLFKQKTLVFCIKQKRQGFFIFKKKPLGFPPRVRVSLCFQEGGVSWSPQVLDVVLDILPSATGPQNADNAAGPADSGNSPRPFLCAVAPPVLEACCRSWPSGRPRAADHRGQAFYLSSPLLPSENPTVDRTNQLLSPNLPLTIWTPQQFWEAKIIKMNHWIREKMHNNFFPRPRKLAHMNCGISR